MCHNTDYTVFCILCFDQIYFDGDVIAAWFRSVFTSNEGSASLLRRCRQVPPVKKKKKKQGKKWQKSKDSEQTSVFICGELTSHLHPNRLSRC